MSEAAPSRAPRRPIYARQEFATAIGMLFVYLIFAVVTRGTGFVGLDGTAGWLASAAELGIIAVPVSMLMIAGEFDLSVGAVLGSTTIVMSLVCGYFGLPLGVGIALSALIAISAGSLNALFTLRLGLPSFIASLATSLGLLGASVAAAQWLTGSTVINLNVSSAWANLFASKLGPFNIAIVWWVAVSVAGTVTLTHTAFGNWMLATGGRETAAREAGVPTARVKYVLFVVTSLGAMLVGIIQAIEFNGGDVVRGQSYVFNSVIAAVIGGTLLTGGYGSVVGTVLGSMTYGIVSIGFYYTGWNTNLAQLVLGFLLLVAVLVNNASRRRLTSSPPGIDLTPPSHPSLEVGPGELLVIPPQRDPEAPLLSLRAVTKRFPSSTAVEDVSLDVYAGEVLCLLGDNGAGKSTLIKLIAGVMAPTSGAVLLDGREVRFATARTARQQGIATVHQDTGTFPLMSVTRNFYLGAEPSRRLGPLKFLALGPGARVALDRIGQLGIVRVSDGDQLVGTLSGGERQALAIARATYFGARLLILDEPTSALGVKESEYVLRLVDRVREQGVAVILITHNPQHALAVADRIAVLIHGRLADTFRNGERTRDEVLNLMAGGEDMNKLARELRRHRRHGTDEPE